MTATTDTPTATWRAAARSMPTVAAAAYLALLLVSVTMMVLALAAGWLSEFAERLAVAGWSGATAIHRSCPSSPSGPGSARGGADGHQGDPVVAHG